MPLIETSFETIIEGDDTVGQRNQSSMSDVSSNTTLRWGISSKNGAKTESFIRWGPLGIPSFAKIIKAKIEITPAVTQTDGNRQARIALLRYDGVFNRDTIDIDSGGKPIREVCFRTRIRNNGFIIGRTLPPDLSSTLSEYSTHNVALTWGNTVKAENGTFPVDITEVEMELSRNGDRPGVEVFYELWTVSPNAIDGNPDELVGTSEAFQFDDVVRIGSLVVRADLVTPFTVDNADTFFCVKIQEPSWPSGGPQIRFRGRSEPNEGFNVAAGGGRAIPFNAVAKSGFTVDAYVPFYSLPFITGEVGTGDGLITPDRHFGNVLGPVTFTWTVDQTISIGDAGFSPDNTIALGAEVQAWISSPDYDPLNPVGRDYIAMIISGFNQVAGIDYELYSGDHPTGPPPKLTIAYTTPHSGFATGVVTERVVAEASGVSARVAAATSGVFDRVSVSGETGIKDRVTANNSGIRERVTAPLSGVQ